MFRIALDKIASATKNAGIERDAYISERIIAKEGYVLGLRVLSEKAVYNTLENTHGRMIRLKIGDRIAGALGRRRALHGYSGDVPKKLDVGDRLNILSLGGVVGRCTSYAPDVGRPFNVEVIGAVLRFPYLEGDINEPAHIGLNVIPMEKPVERPAPIIAVVGTSMNSGKTSAACRIIYGLTRQGYRIAAAKVTGVALLQDVLHMRDYGAQQALSFTNAGLVSTGPSTALCAAQRIVAHLSKIQPDAIVLEFGDGLLGEYGVQEILSDNEFAGWIRAVVLCANDPVGAWGGVPLLKDQYGLETTVVTGPITDNEVGQRYVESELKKAAANALTSPAALVAHVYKEVIGVNP